MKHEIRRYKRLSTRGVNIKFKLEDEKREFDAKLMNISGGGTCFELDLEAEEKISFSVFKPILFNLRFGEKVIKCKGQVMRVYTKVVDNRTLYEIGLEFKDMAREDIKFISDYIHKGMK